MGVPDGPSAHHVEPTMDHLVYGVPDLETTVADFEDRTGLIPVPGGRHIGLGTRNYLLGLGPASYLEIIGPDVEHPAAAGVQMPFGVDRLTEPTLLTWAVHPPDIDRAAAAADEAGAPLGVPRWMQRGTPDGRLLRWRLATAVPLPFSGVTPFLIDWGTTAHPAADPGLPVAPLVEFSASHPDPVAVQRVLAALAISLTVVQGPAALRATLRTPNGDVVLGG